MGNPREEKGTTTPMRSPRHRLLSVIIPAYNSADTLGEQLKALKTQEYESAWEIVVVNNCSTDHTVEVVKQYQCTMPNLRLVEAPAKRNRSYARNVGVQAAQGDALLFCDADDIVAPGWLAALAKALEEHDFVAGVLEVYTLDPYAPQEPAIFESFTRKSHLNFLPFAISCNMAMSRKAFEAVNGFSEEFPRSQDVDISWRLQLSGYSIYTEPAAIVHQRNRTSLWSLWRRSVAFGEAEVNLYRRFKAYGIRGSSLRAVFLKKYKQLLLEAFSLWRLAPHKRVMWLEKVGSSVGRLRGLVRYRTFYL